LPRRERNKAIYHLQNLFYLIISIEKEGVSSKFKEIIRKKEINGEYVWI